MSSFQVTPYVNFQGKAREAMTFYQQALGGDLSLFTVDSTGAAKPAGPDDSVAYARLEGDGVLIIASDGNPKYPAAVGENLALSLVGSDKERLTAAFDVLAEGGRVKMRLTAQPWGGEAGWLTDKFGINWQVNIERA